MAGQLSGREGGVRTRKRRAGAAGEGRARPAEARAGSGQAEQLQTRRRQWRWQRRLLPRLPQDLPRAGPRWRRSLHRVSCHPRDGSDHKRRGEADARAAGGARKRVAGPGRRPRPFLSPPLWTRRDAAEPAPLVLAPEGAEESTPAQAQSRVLPAWGSYCAGSRGTCGTSGSCRSRNVALGASYYSYCHLMDACRTPATVLSTHLLHSSIMHVLSDSYLAVNTLGPYPTAPEGAYHHFTGGKTEAQADQVACPRSCS